MRIEKLKAEINKYRYEYHVLNKQEISDAALDSLKHELYLLEQQYPDLITPDSPTQRVAGGVLPGFKKVTHSTRMISLNDIFSFEELEEWEERNKKLAPKDKLDYFCELKIDGFAISLIYRDSVLVQASTRGDGIVGEEVTLNVKTIEAVPLKLNQEIKGEIEVRGEIYMDKKVFAKINQEQESKGEKIYANPRNLAAGSIRQLDSSIAASRKLDFLAYELPAGIKIATHQKEHEILHDLGFKTELNNRHCQDLAEVKKFLNDWQEKKAKMNYWIDGVVIVLNNNELRQKLGIVGKAPRGMVAYKFPAEQVTTKVVEVTFNVGRTGVLTPLATLEPVLVGGTTVSHATLHNLDEIGRLGIKIGDTVILEKAGEIIPKIIEVLPKLRTGKEKEIKIPTVCPICGSAVTKKPGEVGIYCSNKNCFAQEKEKLIHFVSKGAFDMDGLGPKIIEQLINAGLLSSPADIFQLEEADLADLERFGEKSAANLIKAIKDRQKISLARLIYSLGIRHVGEETAIDLANYFGSLEKITNASIEELEKVSDVGSVVSQSIYDYFKNKKNLDALSELLKYVKIEKVEKVKQVLGGQTFVLTGALETLTRDVAKEKIRALGGDVSESVSSQTDYVVAGTEAGSKLDKAKKLGVKIIDEEQFIKLLKL